MRVVVLGPTTCVSATGEEFVPAPLDRRLLAALAVDRHRVWSVDELADAVWGDTVRESSKLVRNRVSALRARLGPGFIDTIAKGYRLGSAVQLDADEVTPGANGRIERITRDRLASAWRGEPFQDLEDWPRSSGMTTRCYNFMTSATWCATTPPFARRNSRRQLRSPACWTCSACSTDSAEILVASRGSFSGRAARPRRASRRPGRPARSCRQAYASASRRVKRHVTRLCRFDVPVIAYIAPSTNSWRMGLAFSSATYSASVR